MTCLRLNGGCPMTVRELNELLSPSQQIRSTPAWTGPDGTRWEATTEDDRIEPEGVGFICGPMAADSALCRCSHLADLLCDWPIGDGKTCDLPLCRCCAKEIGDDLHVCAIHWPMWLKQTGVERINAWPPKRDR